MRMTTAAFFAAVLVWAATPAFARGTDWETITLGDGSGITLDVPKAVGHSYASRVDGDSATPMSFEIKSHEGSRMSCSLVSNPYGAMSRSDVVAALSDERRNNLCRADGPSATDITIRESSSVSVGGRPAAACTASYVDNQNSDPGQVVSILSVADAEKYYMLTCDVSAESPDLAVFMWRQEWADVVHHMEDSLKLPAR